jgi:integrase
MDNSDLNELIAAARAKAVAINSGNMDALVLSNADKRAYMRSMELLKPTGVLLETAVTEYVQARQIAGTGCVLEAARFFAEKNPKNLTPVTLPELVEKCLEAKMKNGRSKNTIHGPKSRLTRYAETHPGPAQEELERDRIQSFLDTVEPVEKHKGQTAYSPRTINNFIRDLGGLVNFGKAKGYLPGDFNPLAGIDKRTEPGKEEEIQTAAEMQLILERAGLPLQLFAVLVGFAGLRHAEAMRLKLGDICLKENVIKVQASNAKMKVRRHPPIKKNLRAWLQWLLPQRAAVPTREGYVVPVNNLSKPIARFCQKIGFEWKRNALRNTYISTRVTLEKKLSDIAEDAGNSPDEIKASYLHLMSKNDARAWWKIMPPKQANVIELPKAIAAA